MELSSPIARIRTEMAGPPEPKQCEEEIRGEKEFGMTESSTAVDVPEIPVQLTKPRSPKWASKVTGVIAAKDLYNRYVIPQRDHRSRKGYQRELSMARVNR